MAWDIDKGGRAVIQLIDVQNLLLADAIAADPELTDFPEVVSLIVRRPNPIEARWEVVMELKSV